MNQPIFTISLDFELMWGLFDQKGATGYRKNIEGVHTVIPKILEIFTQYNIHATWAVVGMLNFNSLEELKMNIPHILPNYHNKKLSAYNHIESLNPEQFEVYYSGVNLIDRIKKTDNQELGSHTFSHYYCLEPGQGITEFKADLRQAIKIALQNNIQLKSIIFPRNQYNIEYLAACKDEYISAYRGNEDNFFQRPRSNSKLTYLIRIGRLLDSYIDITGKNVCYILEKDKSGLVNIPASFFFRPYNKKLKIFESLKIKRLKHAMHHAAITGGCFHLWWHPHNFGINQSENLFQLHEILSYYKLLQKEYNMRSLTMDEIASHINNL